MNEFKNILGLIILPFVAVLMLILAPVWMILFWWINRKDEKND